MLCHLCFCFHLKSFMKDRLSFLFGVRHSTYVVTDSLNHWHVVWFRSKQRGVSVSLLMSRTWLSKKLLTYPWASLCKDFRSLLWLPGCTVCLEEDAGVNLQLKSKSRQSAMASASSSAWRWLCSPQKSAVTVAMTPPPPAPSSRHFAVRELCK